jgi:hypothetical protein
MSAATETGDPAAVSAGSGVRRPLYPRLLRLRHVHPNAWQRALLGEGALAVAVLLVLADLATAWTLLVLPVAVAGVVKAHDLLAGLLAADGRVPGHQNGAGPEGSGAVGVGPDS